VGSFASQNINFFVIGINFFVIAGNFTDATPYYLSNNGFKKLLRMADGLGTTKLKVQNCQPKRKGVDKNVYYPSLR
jgi:hypothetical protein